MRIFLPRPLRWGLIYKRKASEVNCFVLVSTTFYDLGSAHLSTRTTKQQQQQILLSKQVILSNPQWWYLCVLTVRIHVLTIHIPVLTIHIHVLTVRIPVLKIHIPGILYLYRTVWYSKRLRESESPPYIKL